MDALPPATPPVTAACITQAAQRYGLPKLVLYAVAAKEGGYPGRVSRNRNGTYDLGRMQINTVNLRELSKFGITPELLLYDECVNIHVGAWKLAGYLVQENGDWWRALARYNVGSLGTKGRFDTGMRYARGVLDYWAALHAQQKNREAYNVASYTQ